MIEKAKYELDLLIKQCGDDEEAIEMQKVINDNALKIVETFCEVGHSGMTAEYEINLLIKLLKQENLTPLTLQDDEFAEIEEGVFQNKRNSMIFKQADRFNGKPYNVETFKPLEEEKEK